MNLRKYVKTNEELYELKGASDIASARALLAVTERIRDEERKSYEEKPMKAPEDLRKDVIFKLGVVHGLNMILELPQQAQEYINQLPQGKE